MKTALGIICIVLPIVLNYTKEIRQLLARKK